MINYFENCNLLAHQRDTGTLKNKENLRTYINDAAIN